MNEIVKIVGIALIAGLVGGFVASLVGGNSSQTFAGTTNFDTVAVTGFQVGTSGTTQANQITTTCAMQANNSITATTTGYAHCTGVTGLTSSDKVTAQFATTTVGATAITDNWVIINATASSTDGAVDFILLNLTGGARTPSAASRIGSTTNLWIAR